LDRAQQPASLPLLQRSLALFRELGDRIGQANALLHVAMARLETGEFAAVQQPIEEAQALFRELGDAVGVAWTVHDLARLALDTAQPAEAAALFERSLNLFQALGHGSGAAWSMHNLGRAQLAMGETALATALFEAGLQVFRRLGHIRGEGWALYNLAWVASEAGQTDQAWMYLHEGLGLFRAQAFLPGIFTNLVVGARLVLDDDPAQAARWLGLAHGLHTMAVPTDRARADLIAQWARERLAATTFESAWSDGVELSAAGIEVQLDQLAAGRATVAAR
jgi:tetratricopeptide (TPR) repeat protein